MLMASLPHAYTESNTSNSRSSISISSSGHSPFLTPSSRTPPQHLKDRLLSRRPSESLVPSQPIAYAHGSTPLKGKRVPSCNLPIQHTIDTIPAHVPADSRNEDLGAR